MPLYYLTEVVIQVPHSPILLHELNFNDQTITPMTHFALTS